LKVNQAGTLHDALNFANTCAENNIGIITSHRSGESIDAHISHIAIATASKMIKTGVVGGERVSKLNELLRLSEYDLIKGMIDLSFT
jgi:enolase